MKKAVFIGVGLLALSLLCGCKSEEPGNAGITGKQTVTQINKVCDADVWILPETEKNRKSTVWGTATAAKVKEGESRIAPLCEPGDDGLYLFRMIDNNQFYYSADGITLQDGWTLQISGDDLRSLAIEVADENGVVISTYEVFAARL